MYPCSYHLDLNVCFSPRHNQAPVSLQKTKFFCTAVITKLSPAQRWWFSSCSTCHKTTLPFGSGFRCSDETCVGKGAMPR